MVDTCDQSLSIPYVDDGPGIPGDQKAENFVGGLWQNTGFGLFLAREILAISGITVQETGTYGKGARFEIVVPEGAWQRILFSSQYSDHLKILQEKQCER